MRAPAKTTTKRHIKERSWQLCKHGARSQRSLVSCHLIRGLLPTSCQRPFALEQGAPPAFPTLRTLSVGTLSACLHAILNGTTATASRPMHATVCTCIYLDFWTDETLWPFLALVLPHPNIYSRATLKVFFASLPRPHSKVYTTIFTLKRHVLAPYSTPHIPSPSSFSSPPSTLFLVVFLSNIFFVRVQWWPFTELATLISGTAGSA